MQIVPTPPSLPFGTEEYSRKYQDQYSNVLRLYFNQLNNFNQNLATPSSGNSASRPITNLVVGQVYYDTTLNKPIWWNGTFWKDADGITQIPASLTGTSASGNVGTVI